jgi:hypothetical protein
LQARRETILGTLVPLVDRQVEDAGRLLTLGEGESLVLLESFVRAHDAKLDLINIQLETGRANNELHFLIGPNNRK